MGATRIVLLPSIVLLLFWLGDETTIFYHAHSFTVNFEPVFPRIVVSKTMIGGR
jgi:hypothetical protein